MSMFSSWKFLFQVPRILKYKFLSNNKFVSGKPFYNQPALLLGLGKISFGSLNMV
jgi:hypothetical protein